MADEQNYCIKLDQFLKLTGIVQTGGHAKMLIQSGEVRVNGQPETRRGRKLALGDQISALGETITLTESVLSNQTDNFQ